MNKHLLKLANILMEPISNYAKALHSKNIVQRNEQIRELALYGQIYHHSNIFSLIRKGVKTSLLLVE